MLIWSVALIAVVAAKALKQPAFDVVAAKAPKQPAVTW